MDVLVFYVYLMIPHDYLIFDLLLHLTPFTIDSKSRNIILTIHKISYTEEMLQLRLIQWRKEKQETHEKLTPAKRKKNGKRFE